MNLPMYAYVWRTSQWWLFMTYKPYFDATGNPDGSGADAMFPAIMPHAKACEASDDIDEPLDEYFPNHFGAQDMLEVQAFLKDHFARKGFDLIFGDGRYAAAVKPYIK